MASNKLEKNKKRYEVLSRLYPELAQIEDEAMLLHKPEIYFEYRDKLPNGYTIEDYKRLVALKAAEAERKRETQPIKSIVGVVYFLSGNGFVKIGKSYNLKTRKSWLDIKLPFKVEVTHTIKSNDTHTCEKYFHKKYADKRANGEWFSLTDDDVAEIKSYEEMNF